MPASLVHYNFALENVPEEEKQFLGVVKIGTQGPDMFMAYGAYPFHKEKEVDTINPLGSYMHCIDIAETYAKMMRYANKSEDKELLYAYIDGALMHFTLDRTLHPYIFFETGFDENGKLTGFYKWSHGAYEALLDVVVGKSKGTYCSPVKALACEKEWVKKVSKMWAACSPKPIHEDSFYNSWIDFKGSMKFVFSRTGLRRPILRLMGKYSTAYAMSHPVFIKKYADMDVLNEKHRLWKNPNTGEEHHESFAELWEKASKDYQEVHQILLRAKMGEEVEKDLDDWSLHIDHDGSPIGQKKSFYDLAWKRVKGFKLPK